MKAKNNRQDFGALLAKELKTVLGEKEGQRAFEVLKLIDKRKILLENAFGESAPVIVEFDLLPYLGPCRKEVLAEVFGAGEKYEAASYALEKAAKSYFAHRGGETHAKCAFYFASEQNDSRKVCIAMQMMRKNKEREASKKQADSDFIKKVLQR